MKLFVHSNPYHRGSRLDGTGGWKPLGLEEIVKKRAVFLKEYSSQTNASSKFTSHEDPEK